MHEASWSEQALCSSSSLSTISRGKLREGARLSETEIILFVDSVKCLACDKPDTYHGLRKKNEYWFCKRCLANGTLPIVRNAEPHPNYRALLKVHGEQEVNSC